MTNDVCVANLAVGDTDIIAKPPKRNRVSSAVEKNNNMNKKSS